MWVFPAHLVVRQELRKGSASAHPPARALEEAQGGKVMQRAVLGQRSGRRRTRKGPALRRRSGQGQGRESEISAHTEATDSAQKAGMEI